MHLYDILKQKNARNLLRVLHQFFPKNEGALIMEALGKLQESQELYLPFMRQLTDAMISHGFEIESTGDVGVVIIGSLLTPEMRNWAMWAKDTFQKAMTEEMEASAVLFPTEEDFLRLETEAEERGLVLGKRIMRRFYRTLSDLYGIEFMPTEEMFEYTIKHNEELKDWLKTDFLPRVKVALGIENQF